MRRFFRAAGLGLIGLSLSFAQEGGGGFTFDFGSGLTNPVGNTGRNLNEGWNLTSGVGYNFNSWVGAKLDLGYNWFRINSTALNTIGAPDGSLSEFSATLDPIVHLNPQGHVDFYLTGGGGLFHQHEQFTQPSVAVVPGFDPFFGYYLAGVPANQILGAYSVNKPGIDVGAGFAVGTRFHGKVFGEAKYERVFLGAYHTDFIPVSFGFRWR